MTTHALMAALLLAQAPAPAPSPALRAEHTLVVLEPGPDLAPARLTDGIDAEDHQAERDRDEQARAKRRGRQFEQRAVDALRLLRVEADGRIEQENFNTYEVMRMDGMPKVETITMPSGGFWGGVGEPTIAVAAPAVLNAIFAATGKRIRDLPLKNHDLKKA